MKSSLKLFCIALMSAALMLPACEKKQDAVDDEAGVEIAADEEEEEMEEEEEILDEEIGDDEIDAGDENAVEGDVAEEAKDDEKKPAEAKKAAPKAATPAQVGRLKGSFGGGGVKNGAVQLTVAKDFKVNGQISGEKEGVNFRIPYKGTLSKSNQITATGKKGNSTVNVSGDLRKTGASLQFNGQINGKPFTSKTQIK